MILVVAKGVVLEHGGFVPCGLEMDQGLSLLKGGPRLMLEGGASKSGGRALDLLYRGALQETLDLTLDSAHLGSGWLRHYSE
jgi:hypothetical protein